MHIIIFFVCVYTCVYTPTQGSKFVRAVQSHSWLTLLASKSLQKRIIITAGHVLQLKSTQINSNQLSTQWHNLSNAAAFWTDCVVQWPRVSAYSRNNVGVSQTQTCWLSVKPNIRE